MQTLFKRYAFMLISAGLLWGLAASGNDALASGEAQRDAERLEEVVVTASLKEVRSLDLPPALRYWARRRSGAPRCSTSRNWRC